MASLAPRIQRCTIDEQILQEIYASDQDMYPAPLAYERLKDWTDSCPELSICFRHSPAEGDSNPTQAPLGVIIVLPVLKKHWDNLLVGKLKEIDIDPKTMFARDGAAEVGLHVFHMERFEACSSLGKLRYFAEFALESARDIAGRKDWKVIGYSALTATPAGAASCKRMGFQPTGYEEIFITPETESTISARAQMLCIYPGEGREFEPTTTHEDSVLARSEMSVKYGNESFKTSQ